MAKTQRELTADSPVSAAVLGASRVPRFAPTSVVCLLFFQAGGALAAVDLVVRPDPQTVTVGAQVEIGLWAVSDNGTDQTIVAMDVILTWDRTVLELRDVLDNGPHNWNFVFGFLYDEGLDGLNADCGADVFCDPYTGLPFNDGDALFQAASFTEATATPDGLRVATFRFTALGKTPATDVVIEESLGTFSTTQVLQSGALDVTGNLGSTTVTIESVAIPTISKWGVAIMALLLIVGGKVYFNRRRAMQA